MSVESSDAATGQGGFAPASPDVNPAQTAVAPAPSTEAVQEPVAQPPAESKPAQPKPDENKIPYDRFKEKVDEVNLLKNHLKNLEAKLEERLPPRPEAENPLIQSVVKDMVDNGLEEQAAKALAKSVIKLAESQVQPVKQEVETNRWIEAFAEQHEDFDEVKGRIADVYSALPKNAQLALASDPACLELLYSHVKMQDYEQAMAKAKQEGAETAYNNKQLKAGVTSAPTAAAIPENFDISNLNEKIGQMSMKDYLVNRDKILKSLYPNR